MVSNRDPSAYQPTTLPLGQTGSFVVINDNIILIKLLFVSRLPGVYGRMLALFVYVFYLCENIK